MQHVKPGWLRALNYGLVGVSVLLLGVYVAFEQLGVSQVTKETWGITPLVLTMAGIHAVYVLVTDKTLFKKYPWLVTLVGFTIYAFLNGAIIESSGNTNVVYRLSFGVLIFFSGMLGMYAPLTSVIFTWMILIFTVTGIATPTNASLPFNVVVNIFVTIAGLLGWRLFQRYYITTDREKAQLQETLQEEQFKSNVILESITDGVMIIATEGTVQVLNQSAAQMLGWDKEEATKLDYRALVKPSEEDPNKNATDAITMSLQSGKPEQSVSLLETHHDRQMYVDIVASPIHSTAEEQKIVGLVAVLRDVDEQKHQEQQRSDFISTASHEMRTPVASIQGFLELALNPKVAQVDEKARGYLEKAHEATKHLGELFQDLLTASKSEDGRLANSPKVIELGEFLKEVVEQEAKAAQEKGLQLHLETNTVGADKAVSPLIYVHVDPDRLREVVLNLIENALKYTPKGVITVGASIKETNATIRVADTGMGIAEEDLAHVFQKFYRVDNSATREIGGTGLGLYICKQIVEVMHGRIWVESEVGTGSTFFIELPRISPDEVQRLNDVKAQEL